MKTFLLLLLVLVMSGCKETACDRLLKCLDEEAKVMGQKTESGIAYGTNCQPEIWPLDCKKWWKK